MKLQKLLTGPRSRVSTLNYRHVVVDRLNPAGPGNPTPFGDPPATPPIGVEVGQTLDIYALRSQFSF